MTDYFEKKRKKHDRWCIEWVFGKLPTIFEVFIITIIGLGAGLFVGSIITKIIEAIQ